MCWPRAHDRVNKERAMRRRQLKGLWSAAQGTAADEAQAGRNCCSNWARPKRSCRRPGGWWRLQMPKAAAAGQPQTFGFKLRKDKLRRGAAPGRPVSIAQQSEPGRSGPAVAVLYSTDASGGGLQGSQRHSAACDRFFTRLERRIEAHIFVAFLAYCLHVSLRAQLRAHAPGLTPRSVLEKFAAMQMLDVHFPTTDGRELVFCRYTQPEKDHKMLLAQLGWELPPQSPPQITRKANW